LSQGAAEPPDASWDLARQVSIFADELAGLYGSERARSRELAEIVASLQRAQEAFALSYALLVEGNDADTRAHLTRTTRWASAVVERLGMENLRELRLGFLLHDIGKWAVPKEIIQKPGPLDDEEWKLMRMHPLWGAQMIADVEILAPALDVIRFHHERFDGTGYPYGKKGDEIPLPARVFAIADVFDALTSDRAYRTRSFTLDEAVGIIREGRGSHFDPDVADVFLEVVLRLEAGA
jgi:HD-GYP domain-containing protein (c-di-GMP phosphodiesterase class II)